MESMQRSWPYLLIGLGATILGCQGETARESVEHADLSLCSGMTLASDATGPVLGTVTFTATGPTCDPGESPEYLFRYRSAESTTWLDLQNWSPRSSALWDPTGLPSGRYLVRARARAAGQIASMTPWRELSVLVGEACEVTGLHTNFPSPQPIGTLLAMQATASCSGGTAEYRFWVRSPSGVWTLLRDWALGATVQWDTTGLVGGTYTLEVSTRRVGNPGLDSGTQLNFRLGATCRAFGGIEISPESPVRPGVNVSLRQSGWCTDGATPEVRFSYLVNGSNPPVVFRDWSLSESATWNTTGLPLGEYQLRAELRPNDGSTVAQVTKKTSFALSECENLRAILTPGTAVAAGTAVAVESSITCPPGVTPEYRFSYAEKTSPGWTVFQDWSPASQAVWNTANLPWNNYYVAVEVRQSGLGGPALNSTRAAIAVGDICDRITEFLTRAEPRQIWALNGTARCSSGTPEYRFSYRPRGSSTRTEIQGWSADHGVRLDASNLPGGLYDLILDVRAVGSESAPHASSVHVVEIGNHCSFSGLGVTREDAQGTKLALRGNSYCNAGRATHDFFYRRRGDVVWLPIPARTPTYASWETAGLPLGEYELRTDVRPERRTATDSRISPYLLCGLGYEPKNGVCVDIDERLASAPGAKCDPLVACSNSPGGFSCGACPSGYTGDGSAGCVSTTPSRRFREIATNPQVSCGILEDDASVTCWGRNSYGQGAAPEGAFRDLFSTGYQFCGVRESGDIVCWPDLAAARNIPSGEGFVRGAATSRAVCGMRADDSVTCYQWESSPRSLGSFSAIAASGSTFTLLDSAGAVWVWGSGGALGLDGTPNWTGRFTAIGRYAYDISRDYACGLHPDGYPECWDYGTDPGAAFVPLTTLSEGPGYPCGIRADGAIACWGKAFWLPGSYVALSNAAYRNDIGRYDGRWHGCAIRADGIARCWGDDAFGQATPPIARPVANLSVGSSETCELDSEGQVHCWGSPDRSSSHDPAGTFTQVSAGNVKSCGVLTDQTVRCWTGESTQTLPGTFESISVGAAGVCGITPSDTIACPEYSNAPSSGTFRAVRVGDEQACAIRSDGTVTCWDSDGPAPLEPPAGAFLELDLGEGFGCGIREDRTLECWGDDTFGQSTPPSGEFSALGVGSGWACAVALDGTLACWGDGCWNCAQPPCYGIDVLQAACEPPAGTFTSVAIQKRAPYPYACAVRTDGSTACWGSVVR